MPFHGLKADLELLGLIVSAAILSIVFTGEAISNTFFVIMISILFFLEGIHLELGFIGNMKHRSKQVSLGLLSVFLVTPLIALIFSNVSTALETAFIIVGVSAVAQGSPRVWSNLSDSDGELTAYLGALSLIGSAMVIPVLLYFLPSNGINTDILLNNILFAVVPFITGLGVQRFNYGYLEEARLHFSKLAFWLITLIAFIQLQLLYQAQGIKALSPFVGGASLFLLFGFICFGIGYLLSRFSGLYEKESRAIGYVSMSKNEAVALFLSAGAGSQVIALVAFYYFIRQLTGLAILDLFRHGDFKFRKRLINLV